MEFINEKLGWVITTSNNYYTTDGGITWERRNDMFGTKISFYNDSIGFVLGSTLWETTNAGQSWQQDLSIKDFSVNRLEFHNKRNGKVDLYLVGNKGLILKKTDAIILDVEKSTVNESNSDVSLYPNPFTNAVTLDFMTEHLTDVRLELYNILGERILQQVLNYSSPGKNTYSLNGLDNLSPGVYFIKLNYANKNIFHKIVKLK